MENKVYAHVIEGKVVNVLLWDGQTPLEIEKEIIEITPESPAGIDWDYIDGKFEDNRPVSELPGN